jgi:hypothetical protein
MLKVNCFKVLREIKKANWNLKSVKKHNFELKHGIPVRLQTKRAVARHPSFVLRLSEEPYTAPLFETTAVTTKPLIFLRPSQRLLHLLKISSVYFIHRPGSWWNASAPTAERNTAQMNLKRGSGRKESDTKQPSVIHRSKMDSPRGITALYLKVSEHSSPPTRHCPLLFGQKPPTTRFTF